MILIDLLDIHSILHPNFIKNFTRSFISGSIAQLFKIVVPLAWLAAIIKFSVSPTEILGNLILFCTSWNPHRAQPN